MVLLAGLVPSVVALFGIVKVYESRAVSLRTAEIQNQCTILTNQISASHYFEDTSQEVVNDSLNQLTNIYNGRVMVIDDQLRVVKDTYSLDEGKLDVSESVVRCMKGTSTNNYDKKNHYIEVTAPIAIPGEDQIRGVMLASVSTDSIEDSLDVLYTQGSVIIGLVMIFLTIVAVFAADRVVRPLHQIAATIENVSAGYSDDVLHVDTFTETKSISEAINKMMGRLKLLDENKIITDLLSLVKMDKKGQTLNIESININELLEQILKRLKPIAEKKNVEIVMESFRPVTAEIDETKLSLAISNLVENAVKYNHDNGWVHVSLNADHKFFYVKVEDSGIGIPKEDQAHVFERFFRVDKSHSREIGGTGLGLAIARNAVIAHRGAIKVYSEEGEGTTFTVRIPLIYTAS